MFKHEVKKAFCFYMIICFKQVYVKIAYDCSFLVSFCNTLKIFSRCFENSLKSFPFTNYNIT